MDPDTRQALMTICVLLRETAQQTYETRLTAQMIVNATKSAVPAFGTWYDSPGSILGAQPKVREAAALGK